MFPHLPVPAEGPGPGTIKAPHVRVPVLVDVLCNRRCGLGGGAQSTTTTTFPPVDQGPGFKSARVLRREERAQSNVWVRVHNQIELLICYTCSLHVIAC